MTSNSVQPLTTTGEVLSAGKSAPLVCDELNFAGREYSSSFPKFRKIMADNNQSSTVTPLATGITDVTFTIPADTVWNPAKSKLRGIYTPTQPGAAARFNMIHINAPVFINQIELFDDLQNYLQRVNFLNKATHMMAPYKTSMEDYLQKSTPVSPLDNTVPNYKSEWGGVLSPANRDSANNFRFNYAGAAAVGATSLGKRFISPLYLLIGGENTATPVINFSFKMSHICPNSIWSINKDLYYGPTRVLRLHLGLDKSTMYGFLSQAQAVPTLPAAMTGPGSFTSFWFECAIESDINVIAMIKKRFFERGLEYIVPYTKVLRSVQSNAGLQTAQIQVSRSDGYALKELYVSTYNSTESNSTAYDNTQITLVSASIAESFVALTSDTYGAKVPTFHTEWNAIQIQPAELNLALMDDWRYNEDFVEGSAIDNIDSYYFNWTWVEKFDQYGPLHKKEVNGVPVANIEGGFSLEDGAIQLYNFVNSNAPGALIYYFCVTTLKELKVNLESVYFA
ncbi:MAG: hypothetical protein ACYC3F_16715 [Gemmatimonadaceae bacterium]